MSPMSGGSVPRPSEEAKAAFHALLPDGPAVSVKPMFGNIAAFVNGNMFAGLFGEDLFVRLPEGELAQLISSGGGEFAPMPGRGMKGYATVPATWREQPEPARAWVVRSLAWARELPAKQPKKRK